MYTGIAHGVAIMIFLFMDFSKDMEEVELTVIHYIIYAIPVVIISIFGSLIWPLLDLIMFLVWRGKVVAR